MLAACNPQFHPITPAVLPVLAADVVRGWVADLAPQRPARYDLKWRFENKQGNASGRAVARIAPPDSLRFDYRAPFGHSGAAVILGDSALWARPAADVKNLIPATPLFWLALGAPQAPPLDAQVFGEAKNGRRLWRIVRGGDAMDIVLDMALPGRLQAQWRQN
ncbi:MAG TPA: hypothetical protein VGI83_04155, partial [Gemmatimonadales bacterium]